MVDSAVVLTGWIVCVSAVMIQEIKRIIKDSDILKYASCDTPRSSRANPSPPTGKMIRNGRRRTRMVDRNWKSAWAMNTFLSRYFTSGQV